MLGIFGKPLIKQDVSAWEFGQVINDLYHSLKKYGRDQVHIIPRIRRETYASEEGGVIDAVLKQYGGLSGTDLSALTHSEGSPWHQAVQEKRGRDIVIPTDLIRSYYKAEYSRFLGETQEN